jgi:hypothetical protein
VYVDGASTFLFQTQVDVETGGSGIDRIILDSLPYNKMRISGTQAGGVPFEEVVISRVDEITLDLGVLPHNIIWFLKPRFVYRIQRS